MSVLTLPPKSPVWRGPRRMPAVCPPVELALPGAAALPAAMDRSVIQSHSMHLCCGEVRCRAALSVTVRVQAHVRPL